MGGDRGEFVFKYGFVSRDLLDAHGTSGTLDRFVVDLVEELLDSLAKFRVVAFAFPHFDFEGSLTVNGDFLFSDSSTKFVDFSCARCQ